MRRSTVTAALLLICLLSFTVGGAQAESLYVIEEANDIGFPQSTWENDGRLELSDERYVERLNTIFSEMVPMDNPPEFASITQAYNIQSEDHTGKLYYDMLYYRTYWVEDGQSYALSENAGRFIRELFFHQNTLYNDIPEAHASLLAEHGWTATYPLNQFDLTLPEKLVFSSADEKQTYFAYHDLFLRDAGYDIRPYLGKEITVSIHSIYEGVNRVLWVPEDVSLMTDGDVGVIIQVRAIILSHEGTIIGAYIDAGRHDTTMACSLDGKNDTQILDGKPLLSYIHENTEMTSQDKALLDLTPEALLETFATTEDPQMAIACMSSIRRLEWLTLNMGDDQLYVPWEDSIGLARLEVVSIGKLDDISEKDMYQVKLKNGSSYYPEVIDEGDGFGYRIRQFYNTGY